MASKDIPATHGPRITNTLADRAATAQPEALVGTGRITGIRPAIPVWRLAGLLAVVAMAVQAIPERLGASY